MGHWARIRNVACRTQNDEQQQCQWQRQRQRQRQQQQQRRQQRQQQQQQQQQRRRRQQQRRQHCVAMQGGVASENRHEEPKKQMKVHENRFMVTKAQNRALPPAAAAVSQAII